MLHKGLAVSQKRARAHSAVALRNRQWDREAYLILSAVAVEFDTSVAVLTSPDRHKNIAEIRFIAMWVMREITGMSLPAIGKRLGGRDHTTIIHGIARVNQAGELRASARAMANALRPTIKVAEGMDVAA